MVKRSIEALIPTPIAKKAGTVQRRINYVYRSGWDTKKNDERK